MAGINLDDSAGSGSVTFSDLENDHQEELSKTEMIFEQGGVSQRFTTNDKRRKILIPGKLCFTENKYGEYIEWIADETTLVEPPKAQSVSPDPVYRPSSAGGKDWSSSSGIGFHVGQEDSIEFLPDLRLAEYRRPIKLELAEVRSFLIPSKSHGREVIFNLADGTIQNPLIFERGSPDALISTLGRYVTIRPSRQRDLFMITPKKADPPPPRMSSHLAGLFPDQAAQVNQVFQFVNDIRSDPKAVAFTALAKLADYALTPTPTSERNGRSKSPSPTHRGRGENGNGDSSSSTSINGNGINGNNNEPDYTTNEEGYEVIFRPGKPEIELGERPKTFRGQPLSQEQWLNYLDNDGRVTNFDEIREIVFRGGVDPGIRKHVWVFLLGVYPKNSTYLERKELQKDNTCSYLRMKNQWASITDDQEERFHAFRDFKSLIEKDVARTDRTLDYFREGNNRGSDLLKNILMTYVMYNFNLGYVQGMSDILAPILMEIQDEVLAFWLFAKFMDRIWTNFEMSQEGMQRQLRESYTILQLIDPRFSAYLDACDASNMYFAFRWLLILFKREFSTTDILALWESLWTEIPGPNYQLFIGLAILEEHKTTIMEHKYGLSEILRHINDLTLRIDLCETLVNAEAIYRQILASEDKLPNNIRVIIGLPEKPESFELSSPVNPASPEPDPEAAGDGDGNGQGIPIPAPRSYVVSHSVGPTVEEQSLELQCDMGISQFM